MLANVAGFSTASQPKKTLAGHEVMEALISASTALEAAVADLVDNSIDAGATLVEIRLHRLGSQDPAVNVKLSLSSARLRGTE